MLTDYHLHLRPDEPDTPGERYFTAENVDRYLAAAQEAGIEELGVSEHVYRFTQALELWRHPFWEEQACDDLDAYCEFVRGTPLRLGVECDYIPAAEDRTAALLEARDFDYVVGSVHFIGDAAVDHPGWDVWESRGDADEVWRRYFESLAECARSGLFDILAHPDLVKVWGGARPLPERDPRFFYEPAVEAIADAGAADGLDPELARELVVETAAGTAELLRVRHPADVREAVASPGGSTEAGLEALDREGVREAFAAAVRASLERMRG